MLVSKCVPQNSLIKKAPLWVPWKQCPGVGWKRRAESEAPSSSCELGKTRMLTKHPTLPSPYRMVISGIS